MSLQSFSVFTIIQKVDGQGVGVLVQARLILAAESIYFVVYGRDLQIVLNGVIGYVPGRIY